MTAEKPFSLWSRQTLVLWWSSKQKRLRIYLEATYPTAPSVLYCEILFVLMRAFRYSTITAGLTASVLLSTCLSTALGSRLFSSARKACDLDTMHRLYQQHAHGVLLVACHAVAFEKWLCLAGNLPVCIRRVVQSSLMQALQLFPLDKCRKPLEESCYVLEYC